MNDHGPNDAHRDASQHRQCQFVIRSHGFFSPFVFAPSSPRRMLHQLPVCAEGARLEQQRFRKVTFGERLTD